MPAVLIILAVLIAVAFYFDRGETDEEDPEPLSHSNIVGPPR